MRFVKHGIKSILRRFGYGLTPLEDGPPREQLNLQHLAVAYEYLLNTFAAGPPLPPDERRLQLLGRLLGSPPPKAYAIAQALVRTAGIPGAVCEFGVAQGETSAFIANEILESGRQLHLFDSFEGLPTPSKMDLLKDDIFGLGSIEAYAGTMSCPEDLVMARLEAVGFPAERYTIHRGFIETVIDEDPRLPDRVGFAYVDFDFYEPIKVSLEFLDRVTPVGAVVIVDEYDYFSTGSKTAVDEFVSEANRRGPRYEIEIPDQRLGFFAVLTKIIGTDDSAS